MCTNRFCRNYQWTRPQGFDLGPVVQWNPAFIESAGNLHNHERRWLTKHNKGRNCPRLYSKGMRWQRRSSMLLSNGRTSRNLSNKNYVFQYIVWSLIMPSDLRKSSDENLKVYIFAWFYPTLLTHVVSVSKSVTNVKYMVVCKNNSCVDASRSPRRER